MSEKITPTSTIETPVVDPEAIDEGEVSTTETGGEYESPTIQRLTEAKQQLSDLLDERDARLAAAETPEEDPAPEADKPAGESDTTPEKKEKRNKNILKKIGGWAVESLEANGIIPQRGKWHKRDGLSGFIAKAYVYSKQRKANRAAGFLSSEANAQLNGETTPTAPETDDDHEEETRARLHRRIGRGAVTAVRRTVGAPKAGYRLYKAVKNVK